MALMEKFEGFHKCRPRQRMAYFDVMAIALHNA
jgi:hypothetical protein